MNESEVHAELAQIAGDRSKLTALIAELDERRAAVVRAGFDAGLSAASMSAVAGLSQQRLSQIKRGVRV